MTIKIYEWHEDEVVKPGAYFMPEPVYHADPCPGPSLSTSIEKILLADSQRHAWQAHPKLNALWEPDVSNRTQAVGSACHAMLVGTEQWLHVIEENDYKKKAAKEERDEATRGGFTPVLIADYERAQAVVEAAREQLAESEVPALAHGEGDGEVSVLSNERGIWRRCRLDWWSADRLTVVDYKATQGSANATTFERQVARMQYDLQDAFYLTLLEDEYPHLAGRIQFVFVVQEAKSPPFELALYQITEADREVARRKVAEGMRIWEKCLEEGRWAGYPKHIQRVSLPIWHTKQWLDHEMEMEEAGDSPDWAFAGRE